MLPEFSQTATSYDWLEMLQILGIPSILGIVVGFLLHKLSRAGKIKAYINSMAVAKTDYYDLIIAEIDFQNTSLEPVSLRKFRAFLSTNIKPEGYEAHVFINKNPFGENAGFKDSTSVVFNTLTLAPKEIISKKIYTKCVFIQKEKREEFKLMYFKFIDDKNKIRKINVSKIRMPTFK